MEDSLSFSLSLTYTLYLSLSLSLKSMLTTSSLSLSISLGVKTHKSICHSFLEGAVGDGSDGDDSEEENEVLEESPCGRWRKLRSKVSKTNLNLSTRG